MTDAGEKLFTTSIKLTRGDLRALETMMREESRVSGEVVSRSGLLRRALRQMVGDYESKKAAAVGAV